MPHWGITVPRESIDGQTCEGRFDGSLSLLPGMLQYKTADGVVASRIFMFITIDENGRIVSAVNRSMSDGAQGLISELTGMQVGGATSPTEVASRTVVPWLQRDDVVPIDSNPNTDAAVHHNHLALDEVAQRAGQK